MALYKDATGQLVIATSFPPGGSAVTGPASSSLVDVAPWLRALDAPGDAAWHPGNYYAGDTEPGQSNGYSNVVIFAYQRATTAPTTNPGDITYDFTTGSITTTTLANGWQKTIPGGSSPLYVTSIIAAGQSSTIDLLADDWRVPVLLVADSTAYWLVTSSAALKQDADGIFTPSSVTFSAKSQTGLDAPADYAGRFKIFENASSSPSYVSAANENSVSYAPSGQTVTSIQVELYLADGTIDLLDQGTVVVVNDATGSGTSSLTPVRCYVKTDLGSLSFSPATITTEPAAESASGGGWGVVLGGPNGGWSQIPQTLPSIYNGGFISLPPAGSWGATVGGIASSYSTVPLTLAAGESLYLSDGTYDPATGKVVWSAPYLASLKVGELSAISTNTGSLDVTGTLTVGNNGAIQSGKTSFDDDAHAGFFLGADVADSHTPKFKVGDATNSVAWDGDALIIHGDIITNENIAQNAISVIDYYLNTGSLYPAIPATPVDYETTSGGDIVVGSSSVYETVVYKRISGTQYARL